MKFNPKGHIWTDGRILDHKVEDRTVSIRFLNYDDSECTITFHACDVVEVSDELLSYDVMHCTVCTYVSGQNVLRLGDDDGELLLVLRYDHATIEWPNRQT